MKWKTVKKDSELALEGITIERETHDTHSRQVTFTDAKGNKVRVTADYGMNIVVPAPPEMVTRYRLTGSYKGLAVSETFEYEHEANDRLREFSDAEEDGLKVEKVEVPVED